MTEYLSFLDLGPVLESTFRDLAPFNCMQVEESTNTGHVLFWESSVTNERVVVHVQDYSGDLSQIKIIRTYRETMK